MPETDTPTHSTTRSQALIDALAKADTPDAQADAWHSYLASSGEELHEEIIEAKTVLNEGVPADAVALADQHVVARARAAAGQAHAHAAGA
jgi:hypothetical protein